MTEVRPFASWGVDGGGVSRYASALSVLLLLLLVFIREQWACSPTVFAAEMMGHAQDPTACSDDQSA
jgi:hypothetical protein